MLAVAFLAVACKPAPAPPPLPQALEADAAWLHTHPFLVCTRLHETPGHRVWPYEDGYTYDTGNGYFGAYQFNQQTWAGVVVRLGWPWLVFYNASQTSVEVQDRAAWQLYLERGNQPWGGRC